ncbi:undecaprenyldiphospho-muramoylpentapeptide beta-N-acetylglucosaminyltransferase [Fredinandcohnia quinoae]|uniref:UDP-N-acetylglucosamine--N-acetylmuramyl-(pentapeptide) pyrophosphoryl-undecaprenol N-acetylglucosamine transferase n=1 Tax=Fredinandcohnia quinoae TaxID=2918902 RepID=A0AAW5E509_9BACI|nr:undecaprenyldiphospho-muramoylpentapeptide beta-N-acetylglucosaminyltransferase [Fredinandcohnia sp. SECRCQ15]MCH1623874.1 undecaprenyldiphospho-muramoylpentapeptide beta-N-acetylglucosaminyltransferase [Fredinandcohnia sp. SECRCQ15]
MRIVVSGGGTGGHIYPALALINEIKKINPSAEFLYIGTDNGLESGIVKRENIPFKAIEITGFKRKISIDNIKTIIKFLKGVKDSKKYIKEFNPNVVIGTGGYVCGPVVYAASRLHIPTIIHEQNSVPGITNKFLSRFVDKIAICFEEAERFFPYEKTVLTGNPRASEVMGKVGVKGMVNTDLNLSQKTVLIVGGSRGAKPINDAFIEVLDEAVKRDYQFLYVTGEIHYAAVLEKVKSVGNPKNVIIKPFIHNMPEVLSGVDLIVARAGATTLAEVTALGLPSILIPSPYVTNNHQEKNARSLSDKGAALIRLENELTGRLLLNDIDSILQNQQKLKMMKEASKQIGIPDAARRLYNVVMELT